MRNLFPVRMICYSLLLCLGACMHPGLQAGKHQQYHPPKAILVQLSTETNRMQHFTGTGDEKAMQQLQEDTREITARTVRDFADNFYYCPVYFFTDTNADKIKTGMFENVLLDTNLQPVQHLVLQPHDTAFFIGYYGPRISDFKVNETTPEQEAYRHHNDMDTGVPRWVVLDHNFHSLRSPLPAGIDPDIKRVSGHSSKQRGSAYAYTSRQFNISYAPSAMLYSATLEKFYRKQYRRK